MSRYTEPEWSNSALITIDTQCDTLDGQPFAIPGTSAILPRMRAVLGAFHAIQENLLFISFGYTRPMARTLISAVES